MIGLPGVRLRLWVLLAALAVLVATSSGGCSLSPRPLPAARPGSVLLVVPHTEDPLDDRLAARGASYLTRLVGVEATVMRPRIGTTDVAALDAAAARQGAGLVVVVDAHRLFPELLPPDEVTSLPFGGFVLHARDRGAWANGLSSGTGATFVLEGGPGKLEKQYALTETLRRLGARFYHPEEPFVPHLPATTVRARARTATALAKAGSAERYEPDFPRRSFTFHGAHPLEHMEAFSDAEHPIDEAVRVNEWIVANFGTQFRGAGRGVASERSQAQRAQELESLRVVLGLQRTTGIGLHNVQQGGHPDVDPTSSVPVKDQIEALVAERLAEAPDAVSFGIHFGPTEFTVTPDEETVQWIDWAGQRALELRPDLPVFINDHTTGSQPTEHFDDLGCPPGTNQGGRSDYYDLAFHTDERLGVSVHTVMFYPLEGPARVYNQQSFAHKLCLMEQASADGRPLTWFPEGSWWLSFDNPIPVYLPLYILTRQRDVELVRPLLATRGGTVVEHRMFNSGHEWGYWQQDYAVGLLGYNAELSLEAIVTELVDPLCRPDTWPKGCAAGREARDVLLEVMAHQAELFLEVEDHAGRPGGLFAYFAGEDPADEIAATTGFEFRPVRPSFPEVLAMSNLDAGLFDNGDIARLREARDAYAGWLARLEPLAPLVPDAGRPGDPEVVDGIEIDHLRAKHTVELYEAVLAYRAALTIGSAASAAAAAEPALTQAAETLARAEAVIRRRESFYRYPPEQEYGGGLTPETAVENGTTYPFRVHTKTHLLTYWENRQAGAEALVSGEAGQLETLTLVPAIAVPGTPVALSWPAAGTVEATLDLGDGTVVGPETSTHDYGDVEAAWLVSGSLRIDGVDFPISGAVARAHALARTAPSALTLTQPESELAQGVVSDLAPAFQWAWVGASGPTLAFGPEGADGAVPFGAVVVVPVAEPQAGVAVSDVTDFVLPIQNGSSGSTLPMRIEQATFTLTLDSSDPPALLSPVHADGALVLSDIVDALIALAGFDEAGAYDALAGILEFDPADPPATVPFAADFPLE